MKQTEPKSKLSFKQWLLITLLSISVLDDLVSSFRTIILDIVILLVIIFYILPDIKKND